MELTVLNANLEKVAIIDTFRSLIWTDRYYGAGDFEIAESINKSFLDKISSGAYLTLPESEKMMLIEKMNIKTSVDAGSEIIVNGHSLESILERRIVWNSTVLTGDFQNGIYRLLDENAINPDIPERTISRLEFEPSTDPNITELTVDSQFNGESLYKTILDLCINRNVGFKIVLTDEGMFRFKLYYGADRSYSQIINNYVVFSPSFDNLLNSNYTATSEYLKTLALVAGEAGVGNERVAVIIEAEGGGGSDLDRRELYVDAKGVTRTTSDGTLTDEEYYAQLAQKGQEELAKNIVLQTFEGQSDINGMYRYGTDFYMGDILQVENEFGHKAKSRVTELILSQDETGIKAYPTFTTF